jgi:AcrR family transcriptional regulator
MGAQRSARAPRRPTSEIRALLVEAARELFVANGYEATRIKEISLRAGVAEQLIFTNFGSKAGLFDAAVVAPFSEFVSDYLASWGQDAPESSFEERVGLFVERLYALAEQDRKLLIFSIARRVSGETSPEGDIPNRLATLLQTIQPVTLAEAPERGFPDPDASLLIAASAAMVLGMALLDDLLFPVGSARPTRARITADLTTLLVNGFRPRPRP